MVPEDLERLSHRGQKRIVLAHFQERHIRNDVINLSIRLYALRQLRRLQHVHVDNVFFFMVSASPAASNR